MTQKAPRLPTNHPRLVTVGGVFYYRSRTLNGRRIERSLKTRNAKEAEREAAKRDTLFYANDRGWDDANVTFGEWWGRFQEIHTIRYANAKGFVRAVSKVPTHWHTKRLTLFTEDDAEAFVHGRLKAGTEPGTVGLERRLLRVIFAKAISARKMSVNPFDNRMTGLRSKIRYQVLTREDEARLMAVASTKTARVVQLLLLTGMRSSELLHAALNDLVQLPSPGLRVVGKGGKLRVIPLDTEGVRLAKALLPLAVCHRTLLANFQNACIKAGLVNAKGKSKLTLHDLRRTCATRCGEDLLPLQYIQSLMGHASPATTSTYYSHLTSGVLADALFASRRGEFRGNSKKPAEKTVNS